LFAQAEAAVASLASSEPRAFLHKMRAFLAMCRGDNAESEESMRAAVALFRELGPSVLVWHLAPLGLIQLSQGKRQGVLDCMHELETLLASQQEGTIVVADVLSKLALMALGLDDHERVVRSYPQLLPFQGRFLDVLLDRVLGEMEIVLGAWPQAHAHLKSAEEMARREGILPELAHTLIAQGTLLLRRGGRGSVVRARTLFEEALALLEQLRMPGETRGVRQRLEQLPKKSPVKSTQPLPAGLTTREVEVLRLIVAGKSNRQIAEALVLSQRTVANHLAHILNKTGTDNRAAATAFAIRHGLA
jgi:ATP/maltotriose-dependent transcriptional regulator MalT